MNVEATDHKGMIPRIPHSAESIPPGFRPTIAANWVPILPCAVLLHIKRLKILDNIALIFYDCKWMRLPDGLPNTIYMRSFKTMSLSHFDPLANIRLFEDAFTRMLNEPPANRPWSPAVDIYETENELVLKADVPDVDPKDIDVRVENQTLTISGERKFEQEDMPARAYHRIERSYGSFVAQFRRAQHLRHRQHCRRLTRTAC